MVRSELLDHLQRHVLDDKSDMLEGAPDSVWTPEVLTRYLSKAQEIYCQEAWVLEDDSTASVCQVTLVANQAVYSLHSSIIRVLSVTPNDSEVDLGRASYENARPRPASSDDEPWGTSLVYSETPARPLKFSTDRPVQKLRLWPAPSAAETAAIVRLNLRVIRMPLTSLKPTDTVGDPSPEIPERYHLSLVDYAAGRALSHSNLDGKVRAEGRDYLKTFFADVARAKKHTDAAARGPAVFRFGGWGRGSE